MKLICTDVVTLQTLREREIVDDSCCSGSVVAEGKEVIFVIDLK